MARTVAVNMLVTGEIVYLYNVRHFTAMSLEAEAFTGNRVAAYAVAALVALRAAFTYAGPANIWFGSAPIAGIERAAIGGTAVLLFLLVGAESSAAGYRLGGPGRGTDVDDAEVRP